MKHILISIFFFKLFQESSNLDPNHYYLGVAAGFGAAIFAACMVVAVNHMKQINHNVLVFYSGLGGLIGTGVLLLCDEKSKIFYHFSEVNWTHLMVIVIMGMIALWISMISYQMVSPTVVSILKSQEIVFAFIIQSVVENTFPSHLTIIGALLVFLSGIIIPMEEQFLKRLPENVRKYF